MARGRGRLREDDEEQDQAPQLPPSAVVANRPIIPNEEVDEERQKQRDLDDLLGEADSVPASEPSDAEELFDDDLLQRYLYTRFWFIAYSFSWILYYASSKPLSFA